MDKITLEQRVFLYDCYVKCKSAKKCRRKFKKKFPGVEVPHRNSIENLVSNLRTTGELTDSKPKRRRKVFAEEKLEESISLLEHSPRRSMEQKDGQMFEAVWMQGAPGMAVKQEPVSELDSDEEVETESRSIPSPGITVASYAVEVVMSEPGHSSIKTEQPSDEDVSQDPPDIKDEIKVEDCDPYEDNEDESRTPPVASPKTSVTSFWQCGVCGKKYPSNKALVRHQRSHTEQRPYSCDFCEKTYSEKRNLVSHIRMHTGERPYRCDLCEKTFTVYGSLASHKRTHTGERPYACDLCRKTFIQSNGLVKHLRTHTGERPYRCDFCQKTFSQSSSLVRHLRTHIGEHPCENGVTTKEDGHIREPNMT